MRSLFHNLTLIQDEYNISIANGAQAVGDHKGCASGQQLVECLLDQAFGARVNAGGGFVQNENARVGK